MTSQDILYSAGKNDECYTLDYGVKPILKYMVTKSSTLILIMGKIFLHMSLMSIGIAL